MNPRGGFTLIFPYRLYKARTIFEGSKFLNVIFLWSGAGGGGGGGGRIRKVIFFFFFFFWGGGGGWERYEDFVYVWGVTKLD